LFLGFGLTLLVVWIIAAATDIGGTNLSLEATEGLDANVWVVFEQGIGAQRITVTRQQGLAWAPMRAAGPPDTMTMGDNGSAWASLTQDGQVEWLELDFPPVASPKSLQVFETLSPGSVVRATVFDEQGNEVEAWKGSDPGKTSPSGIYVANIPLAWDKPATRVRIYLDSPKFPGWNEIDAVGLVDSEGSVQWAQGVRASTTYATVGRSSARMTMTELAKELPYWLEPTPAGQAGYGATQVIEAYGWPMLAMASEIRQPPPVRSSALILRSGLSAPVASAAKSFLQPIWLGLLADSAVYGLVLFGLYLCTAGIRRMIRESGRLRRGCCIACGYDVRYDFAGGCPECGWNRLPERIQHAELSTSPMPIRRA
jgi:hypothetical protein